MKPGDGSKFGGRSTKTASAPEYGSLTKSGNDKPKLLVAYWR
jgi:hypothetical protein